MSTKYAVLARTTRLQSSTAINPELENIELELQNFTVAGGTLVKIVPESQNTEEEHSAKATSTVQVYVYDTVLREPNTAHIYQCALDSLLPVSDDLWPFIVSIPEPQRRLQLLLDTDRCHWLNSAMPGDLVSVPGRFFAQDDSMRYNCIVCYIGPVPEIHPVGYFFGLELLDDNTSPQEADIQFTRKYFECEAKYSIFTTGDRIIPTPAPHEEEPVAAENGNEAPENDWSIINLFNNAMHTIRSTLLL